LVLSGDAKDTALEPFITQFRELCIEPPFELRQVFDEQAEMKLAV
jgi:hypothetical protein